MEIQLFFSISILPLTASKDWNFPDNLDFKGKIDLKRHLFSICNNMTVKTHINLHIALQKVCHLHNGIFHSINLCHILSILLYHLPLCYSLKVTKYMAASLYHVILKEIENRVFRLNHIFRHACIYKQSMLTK